MNKSTQLILGIISVLVIGGGIGFAAGVFDQEETNSKQNETEVVQKMEKKTDDMEKNEAMVEEEIVEKKEEATMVKEDEAVPVTSKQNSTEPTNAKTLGSYTSYSQELVSKAETMPTVLFFHATWCPTCRATDKDINNNLDTLEESGVQVLKVDYDTSTDLKKQYGVTSQHTFVKVDKDGKQLAKTTGLATVADVTGFATK
jgi:thioredoxin 1